MADFVQNVDDIRINLKTIRNYFVFGNEEERGFARERLRLGHNLVAAVVGGDVIFGPSRFVGYKSISLKKHRQLGVEHDLDGKQTDPKIKRILGKATTRDDADWKRIEERYLWLCEKVDVVPSKVRKRKFWTLDELTSDPQVPNGTYTEGALSFYVSTRHERDASARKACIEAQGTSCMVCGFNFEGVYGARGKGFIHVHHLKPLSMAGAGRRINPEKDLVPVCPNCHYMLNRGDQMLSPADMKTGPFPTLSNPCNSADFMLYTGAISDWSHAMLSHADR